MDDEEFILIHSAGKRAKRATTCFARAPICRFQCPHGLRHFHAPTIAGY